MQSITASFAKQNFGQALRMSAQGPVRVERHRKTVAGLVSPQWLDAQERRDAPSGELQERQMARRAQQQTEQKRILWHQRVVIALLCAAPYQRRRMLARARDEVQRWQEQRLCSPDYIKRWRKWLALDLRELAQVMCADAGGWGNAMRQNSPFRASTDKALGA